MFRYWTEDSPEARDFSTILVGLLSESTQGAADPNELLRIASTDRERVLFARFHLLPRGGTDARS
jgi:hypothetical protein